MSAAWIAQSAQILFHRPYMFVLMAGLNLSGISQPILLSFITHLVLIHFHHNL